MPARADAARIIVGRALRGAADGMVSVLLVSYLTGLGFTSFAIGAIVTGTLLGSAVLTIVVGLVAHRVHRRQLLLAASAIMCGTGLAFGVLTTFWPLFAVAVLGTLNPSVSDVSVFLPVEQAALAQTAEPERRTRVFAWYNVCGNLAGAFGALASGLPDTLARAADASVATLERAAFLVYAAVGVVVAALYGGLGRAADVAGEAATAPLAQSRRVVLRLAALFSLDSFGGGFVVQSLLVLWLYRRFGLSPATTGGVFFAAGVLGGLSQLASPAIAARIGLVRTMAYTHLPANLLLVAAGLVPTAPLAVGCLLVRAALSQMDVPARQAYVMALVPPAERAAAASLTNVPRSLAAALPPLIAGALLDRSAFGWPLVCGGTLKALYDLLLLAAFGRMRPAHERELSTSRLHPVQRR